MGKMIGKPFYKTYKALFKTKKDRKRFSYSLI
jgi:hypothetical protein